MGEVWGWIPGGARVDLRVILGMLLFLVYPFHSTESFGDFSVNLSYGDPLVALLVFGWVVGLFGARSVPQIGIPILALFLVIFISFIVNVLVNPPFFSPIHSVVETVKLLGAVGWGLGIYALAQDRADDLLPKMAFVSVFIASIVALWTIYLGLFGDVLRPRGTFDNPNIFAHYLLLHIAFGLYLRETPFGTGRFRSSILLGCIPVFAVGIFVTGSRGGMIGLVGFVLAVIVLSPRIGVRELLIGGTILLVGVVVGGLVTKERSIGPAISPIDRAQSYRGIDGRFERWSVAVDAILSQPIVGIGYGQYNSYSVYFFDANRLPHNVYFAHAAEIGLIGLFVFLAVSVFAVWHSYSLRRIDPGVVYLGAFVVGTLAQGVGTDVEHFRGLWIGIGCIAAYHMDWIGDSASLNDILADVKSRLGLLP